MVFSELYNDYARRKDAEAEILRLRTTETDSAHALDRIRQYLGLELIPQEHPAQTANRIEATLLSLTNKE
jgi:hypothetical protein